VEAQPVASTTAVAKVNRLRISFFVFMFLFGCLVVWMRIIGFKLHHFLEKLTRRAKTSIWGVTRIDILSRTGAHSA
jgi:purine-cytosine permease-like protein